MVRLWSISLCLLLVSCTLAHANEVKRSLYNSPDVSQHWISFIKDGNIWLVSREGGVARQLTDQTGVIKNARFSPDGSAIAYTRLIENNLDIHVIPTIGGASKQLTFHPEEDTLVDWHPSGKSLLIKSKRESYRSRFNQFYLVSVNGGLPEKLALPYAETGGYCADANTLLFTYTMDFEDGNETWKRYKGGRAPNIWRYDIKNNTADKVTDYEGIDIWPMCDGEITYFSSDRGSEQRVNLWKHDDQTGEFLQLTDFDDHDIRHPAMGNNAIVYEHNGHLYVFDINKEKSTKVSIDVQTTTDAMSPRFVSVQDNIKTARFADNGSSIFFNARGDILNYDIESKVLKHVTHSSGAAERFATESAAGAIAYVSDQNGEYQLFVKHDKDKVKTFSQTETGYIFQPHWSPEGQHLAFVDEKQKVHIFDTKRGRDKVIATGKFKTFFALQEASFEWSPDSQWLLFTLSDSGRNQSTFLYNVKEQSLAKATNGFFNDKQAIFCGNGAYICLLSQREFQPTFGDTDSTWTYADSTSIYLLPLTKQIHQLSVADKEMDISELRWKEIATTDLEQDIIPTNVHAGNLRNLFAHEQFLIYQKLLPGRQLAVYSYDLLAKKERELATNAWLIDVSTKGKLLVKDASDNQYKMASLGGEVKWQPISLESYQLFIDPALEKQQIVREAWRLYRDFYYDPSLHGKDWNQEWERYRSLLDAAHSKEELNRIVRALGGELEGGHVWATSTFARVRWKNTQAGLLGIDLKYDQDQQAYQIKKIYQPAPWLHEQRSPLAEAGYRNAQGQFLVAVNGKPLSKDESPWKLLYGYINKPVELSIRDKKGKVKQIVVNTIANERLIREMDWVERNRQYVERMTNGQVGYLYVRDTSMLGQEQLMKQYQAQFDKKALIIDARFNSGGALGDRLVELLNRPVLNYFSTRNAVDTQLPEIGNSGAKILLTNGWSYSGGDGFPFLFQQAGVGPVLGERTWGGLIGPSLPIPLINGGAVSPPPQRVYDAKGQWGTGGDIGVTPDILVENTISALLKGEDEQLNKAIEWTTMQIEKGVGNRVEPPIAR